MVSQTIGGRDSKARRASEPIESTPESTPLVRTFHQILLWPLQLLPLKEGSQIHHHWELLEKGAGGVWKEVDDEFCADPDAFQERHYREFVTFLPYVQRLLYGEGAKRRSMAAYGESPIKAYRRTDVAAVRILFPDRVTPVVFDVRHVDLYFFYDVDLVILAVEVSGSDLPLDVVQDTLHRFGRAYPAGWTAEGDGINCPRKVEWLAADGRVLAVSDYEDRKQYLASVCRERAPPLAAHWQYLLNPMAAHHSDQAGALRFRHLEYYRMPLMAYLAVEHPEQLTRADFARLAYANAPGDRHALPYSEKYLASFEENHCYDRYYDETQSDARLRTRVMCCDHAFLIVGDAARPVFLDAERGVLGQFRHQFFLLALIAHMHKGALLMMSDRLVHAVTRLNIEQQETVRRFRAEIRGLLEIFHRFTHRYWFHDVSEHVQTREVFHALVKHLGTDRLYVEIREELKDMGAYLDSDLLRRQSNIFLRLTVVTMIGLIGTTTTGFLGMSSLIAATDHHLAAKAIYVAVTAAAFAALTLYTLAKSQRIAGFLDALTNERLPLRTKAEALLDIWRRK
ncbi:hypothetical protein JQ597_35095 [Bradyrhizobium sp. AUGA SZCCT0177]|uniref:hypothetical protein n=1 Tax=Bradyrhizobium sp. AUGA SZCCT0177 TaxID=2807665 RepID=UPI001BA55F9F|nr:hypothetical protein [Bradyrhizobium sp. AUGA SZCCT0177]MBR1287294.1 hypothetical protein [Bradyrhizobium sp. AUGA SZCCT0177]